MSDYDDVFRHSLPAACESPLHFAQYGLDRMLPLWRPVDPSKYLLNLGPGNKHIEGTFEHEFPDWDGDYDDLPYPDNSVGGVFATHFLEHLRNPINVIQEVGRVLAPNCPFNILVPHAESRMFLHDIDHKTPFVLETWKILLGTPYYDKFKYDPLPFELGVNFTFSVKEDNTAIITQLIKKG